MRRKPWHFSLAGVIVLALAGCEGSKPPPPREYLLVSPYNGPRTFAVAPTLNLSGSHDFDSLTVSDQIFGELQQVSDLTVLPVNKVIAGMQHLGMRTITSADAAQRLTDEIGADALLVPVITLYDPYSPPTVGMTMQLYTGKKVVLTQAAEPMARDLSGRPIAATPTTGMAPPAGSPQPVSQVAAVFNAHNQTVLAELRDFARGRSNYDSALQEDRFLADIDAYTRFVSHAMIRRLMEVERARVAGR